MLAFNGEGSSSSGRDYFANQEDANAASTQPRVDASWLEGSDNEGGRKGGDDRDDDGLGFNPLSGGVGRSVAEYDTDEAPDNDDAGFEEGFDEGFDIVERNVGGGSNDGGSNDDGVADIIHAFDDMRAGCDPWDSSDDDVSVSDEDFEDELDDFYNDDDDEEEEEFDEEIALLTDPKYLPALTERETIHSRELLSKVSSWLPFSIPTPFLPHEYRCRK